MSKKFLWLVVSGLMALSLVMAACGPAAVEEKKPAPAVEDKKPSPVAEEKKQVVAEKEAAKSAPDVPKYGGILTFSSSSDITDFDSSHLTAGNNAVVELTQEGLWMGDWAKGPAGGYGTNETTWGFRNDVFALKAGYLIESTKWTADVGKGEGTIIHQVRRGVRWGLNPNREASRLVNGREFTADDVVFELKRAVTNPRSYIYGAFSELRTAEITKTGPWEVTIKLPLGAVWGALSRIGDSLFLHAPEVIQKYADASSWRNSVGTGAFILIDYIPGSIATLVRNPNYWKKDPVGPGEGNQLPYVDGVKILVIPDASTRLAAMRTGKIDRMYGLRYEDVDQLKRTSPALLQAEGELGAAPLYINTKRAPFNDVRVRQAMLLATDLEAIRQSVNYGLGQILTFPYAYVPSYAGLYLGLDDPEMPASVKELYTYNPEKAKQLLKEAGYPNGFKTSITLISTDVDYHSILKDMWAKVGIEVKLDVRETAARQSLTLARDYDMVTGGYQPPAIYYNAGMLWGVGLTNRSQVNDPYVNERLTYLNEVILTEGEAKAMAAMKGLMKYVLGQVYAIPTPTYAQTTVWWTWVKNYSGEYDLGYHNFHTFAKFVWIDQALKKSMGY